MTVTLTGTAIAVVVVATAGAAVDRSPQVAGAVGSALSELRDRVQDRSAPPPSLQLAAAVDAPRGPQPLWAPKPIAKPRHKPRARRKPARAAGKRRARPVASIATASLGAGRWPGNGASPVAVAQWMGRAAIKAGLPAELPVMASLVESGLRNLPYGDRDSVGLFQMRLGIWNHGRYRGYLENPELQMRWFIDRAVAVRASRLAAGGEDPRSNPARWGEWIADVERPAEAFRGRYQERLEEASLVLNTLTAPSLDGVQLPGAGTAGEALAARVIAHPAITLSPRTEGDLLAGRVDPRVAVVLLAMADRHPISISVFRTGHSYLTANGSVSNHSFGRAVDVAAVDGEPVTAANDAARELAVAIGRMDERIRPTEIGSPWPIDEPGHFTDGDHHDHLHIGFDDPLEKDAVIADSLVGVTARRPTVRPSGDGPAFQPGSVRPSRGTTPQFEAVAP